MAGGITLPLNLWRGRVRAYLAEHFTYYALVFLLFVMGVVFGALTVNHLTGSDRAGLLSYLRLFVHDFQAATPVPGSVLARDAILGNLKTLGFLFVLGITAIGAPFILLVIFTRGFVLGFTVGLLVKELYFKGFFFALISVTPHNLFLLPALIVAAVAHIDFGVVLIRSRLTRRPIIMSREIKHCLFITCLAAMAITIGSLVEGYFSPVLMSLVTKYLS
jgi:stage II sporulation protein M